MQPRRRPPRRRGLSSGRGGAGRGRAGPKLDPDGERPRCARIIRITAGSWQILLFAHVASGVEDLIEAEATEALTLKGFARRVPAFNVLRPKSPA